MRNSTEHKGNNAGKFLGYSQMCQADAWNEETGNRYQAYEAWASGHMPTTKKNHTVFKDPRGKGKTMYFSAS